MMTGCEKRSREMRTQRTVPDSRLAFFLARSGGRRAARAGDSTRQVEVPAPADAHEARLSDLESQVYVPAWHVSQVLGMVHSNGEADFGRLAQLRMQIQAREYGAAGLSVRVILHRDTDVTPKEAQYYWVFASTTGSSLARSRLGSRLWQRGVHGGSAHTVAYSTYPGTWGYSDL